MQLLDIFYFLALFILKKENNAYLRAFETKKLKMNNIQKYIAAFLGLAILIFSVWYFSAIVAYILISVVISFVGRPMVERLTSLKIGRFQISKALAATITLLLIWCVFVSFFYVLTPLVVREFDALRNIDYTMIEKTFQVPVDKLNALLSRLYEEPVNIINLIEENLKKLFKEDVAMGIFNSVVGTISNLLIALFSITFMTFFFLKDSNLFIKGVQVFTPNKHTKQVGATFDSIKRLLVRYFSGILLEVSIIFTLITLGLWIVGIKISTALVIALIASSLNVIPYIGPLVGTVLGVFVAVLNNIHLAQDGELLAFTLFTLLVFLIVQLLDNLVLQPMIYSSSVYAHPLEIFLVIMVAGSLAGPIGMILAVPAYTIFRVIGYEFFAQYELVKRLTKGISNDR